MFKKSQHIWYCSLEFADLCVNSIPLKKLLNGHSILHKTLPVRETLLQLSRGTNFNNMQSYKTTLRPLLEKLFLKCLIS